MFYTLASRPDIMAKLVSLFLDPFRDVCWLAMRSQQAEVDEMMSDPLHLPDAAVLQDLPYLNAFFKECK
jgi:hypothetical protein